MSKWGSYIFNAFWIGVIVASAGVVFYLLGIEDIAERVGELGIWAPMAFMLAKMATLVIAPAGGTPLYILAGALFGPWWGFVYLFVAELIGSLICFHISRRYGRGVMEHFLSKKGMPVAERILQHLSTVRGLYEAQVYFIYLQEVVAYAVGLSRISFKQFFLSRLIIFPLPTLLIAWLGSGLFSLSRTETTLLSIVLGGLFILGVWKFYLRTRQNSAKSE